VLAPGVVIASTESVGLLKQGHTAYMYNKATAVGGVEQALDSGRKSTEVTATDIARNFTEANSVRT